MADTEDDNPTDSLHKCIFEDDYRKLSQLIRTIDVSQKDRHGTQKFNCILCKNIEYIYI